MGGKGTSQKRRGRSLRRKRAFSTSSATKVLLPAGEVAGFLRNFPGIIFQGRIPFRPIFFTGQVRAITGYAAEELLGGKLRWDRLILREDLARIQPSVKKIHTVPNSLVEREYRIRTKDGRVRWVRERIQNVCDGSGRPKFVQGTIYDITAHMQAESALRASEEKYRTLFESAPDSIAIMDLTGKILDANGYFGLARDQELGKNFLDLSTVLPADRVWLREKLRRLLKDGRLDPFEMKIKRVGGGTQWIEVHAALLKKDGKAYALQAISRDITEHRRAAEALRASEEKYRTLFESAPESISILDLEGKILEANRFFGMPWDQVIGKNFLDLTSVFSEDKNYLLQLFDRLRRGENLGPIELKIKLGPDSIRWIEIHAVLLRREGKPFGIQVISRDITDRKQLEDRLRQAQKMEAIGRLAGGVAHDFNNQLVIISSVSELLEQSFSPEDPRRGQIQMILRAADQSASLTRQLLAFSHKQMVQPQVLNLNQALLNLKTMLGRLIGEDIVFNVVLAPNLGEVKLDPTQLEQMVINLAVNARDAMPGGGKLRIETANLELDRKTAPRHPTLKPGAYVMMKVSDTGTGMDKQTLAHVFEPFFTTKPMGKGTGLGLSTVYGIVQQAGGEIEVQSEPGKGTTFRIYLPRAQSSPGRQPKPKAPRPAAGTETILLAEDNPEVRQALAGLLRSNRYQVLEARDGEQAWNLFRANRDRIDLLISDVIMTGMSGKELARRITEQWPKTKILFVSGYAHSLITKSEFQNPKVQFLQKPFKLEAFLEQVRGLLAK